MSKQIQHKDIVHIDGIGKCGRFYEVGTIAAAYAEDKADAERNALQFGWAIPERFASLESFTAHNAAVGGPDRWLNQEAGVIASDGLNMWARYARAGVSVKRLAVGDVVELEGRTYRISDAAKLIAC